MKIAVVFLALAFFVFGQVFTIDVEYIFLGWRWVDVPKYPGDFGLLKFSFYLADRHVDVSVALQKCGFAETAKLPSAGPGVVDVVVKYRADKLGVSADCVLVFKSRYVSRGGGLVDGVVKVEHVRLEVPHYPSPRVFAEGELVAGVRGRVLVVVRDVYSYNGSVEISAVGARVYGSTVAHGDFKEFVVPVEVVADGPGAALSVVLRARDALGREVVLSRQVPLQVKPRPLPRVSADVEWLMAGVKSYVKIRVEYPFSVGGVIYALGFSAPLTEGRGEVVAVVTPEAPRLVLPVLVQLDTGAVDKVELYLPVYPISDGDFEVEASPQVLNLGEAATVVVKMRGRGEFSGQISVSGAVVLGQSPVFFRGEGEVTAALRMIPTSQIVTLDVSAVVGGRFERRVVSLVASQRTPFDVSAEPLEIPSGRSTKVKLRFQPRVNVSEATVTIWPGQNAVFPQRTVRIPPAGGEVEVEVVVAEDVVGNVALNYRIVYTLASGVSGEYVGHVTLLAFQPPALHVDTSIVPDKPEAGRPFYLVVRLYNSAGAEARDVKVYVQGDVTVVRTPPPLANIPPQVSKDATFTLASDSSGLRRLRLVVEYRDKFGGVYTVERELAIEVANSTPPPPPVAAGQQDGASATLAATLALAAVAAVLIWLAVKRGRVSRTR